MVTDEVAVATQNVSAKYFVLKIDMAPKTVLVVQHSLTDGTSNFLLNRVLDFDMF